MTIERIEARVDKNAEKIEQLQQQTSAELEFKTHVIRRLDEIYTEVRKTNGRVTRLESKFANQSGWIAVAVVFIPIIVSVIVTLVKGNM